MTGPDTAEQNSSDSGFSSRWILDQDRRTAATGASGPAAAAPAANPIDTDGDGIADTLAVRVDQVPSERSTLRAFGRWVGRSIVSIVVVASLLVAAVAVTELMHARDDRDAAQGQLASVEAERDAATAQVARLQDDLRDARFATLDAKRDARTAAEDLDAVELENRALRSMLLDSERDARSGE